MVDGMTVEQMRAMAIASRARSEAVVRSATTYLPYPHQAAFHSSQAKVRAVFAANQSGKSYAAAQDDLMLARGVHPYRQWWSPPVHIRVVADGYKEMIDEFLVRLYRSLMDPAEAEYSRGSRTFTFRNGSTIQFMSSKLADLGTGAQKFAAVQLHRVHFEEYISKDIYDESVIRLLRHGGDMTIVYTPIMGTQAWYHDEIYVPWQEGKRADVECFTGWRTDDNRSLSRADIDRTYANMDDRQVRIRRYGEWINIGGGVYAGWDPDYHFVPYDQTRVDAATKTVIIDPHPSKATAVLWCGVGWDEWMFAYREYREAKRVKEICDDIRRLSGERGEDVRRFLIDPHWGWTNTEMGASYQQLFRDNGIPVEAASREKWAGIERMRGLLSVSPTTGRAGFEVMATCPRLAWEFKAYSFQKQTRAAENSDRLATVDADDDLVTCARYFVQSDPRYLGASRHGGRGGGVERHLTPIMRSVVPRQRQVVEIKGVG